MLNNRDRFSFACTLHAMSKCLILTCTCVIYYLNRYPGTMSRVLNLGSYNYLGFAESGGPCVEDVVQRIMENGLSVCSSRKDLGNYLL